MSNDVLANVLAQAQLPLTSPDGERGSTPAAAPLANPTPDANGWVTCGDLRVKGGTYGVDFVYTAGTLQYHGSDYTINGTPVTDVVEVLTGQPLTFSSLPTFNTANEDDLTGYSHTSIVIREGNQADITFDNVNILHYTPLNIITNAYDTETGTKANDGAQVRTRTRLHLTLADHSTNRLRSTANICASLHCGEGSDLIIDDAERNVDAQGAQVIPVGGVIGKDVTLQSGKRLTRGQAHQALDSESPGVLRVWNSGSDAAAIGGNNCESGGGMTFNGGVVAVVPASGADDCGAGIGGGAAGNGTDTLLLFNSGTYQIVGGNHGAGVGGGCYDGFSGNAVYQPDLIYSKSWGLTVGGDITINGGFIRSEGGAHGNGFGGGCYHAGPGYNTGHTITVTGGTLIPSGGFADLGGYEGHVVISGGSVYSMGGSKFQGIGGTAWGSTDYSDDENKVFMITVDLSADGVSNEAVSKWDLSIDGEPYPYGMPAQFHEGKLYLWLPASAQSKVISIDLGYKKEDGTLIEPDTLFRDPTSPADPNDPNRTKLKRYEDFELDPTYLAGLKKYYDGKPLQSYDLKASPIAPPKDPSHMLTDPEACDYKYQRYDAIDGKPLTAEISTGNSMPTNAGVMKFTMISRQYSATEGFKESYWGHRATGWCEIWPIASQVHDLVAEWVDDNALGSVAHPSDQVLKVSATIGAAPTVDGNPGSEATKATCRAPHGRVQIYVDGQPVGSPVDLVYAGDLDAEGNPIPAGDARVTAEEVENGRGGSTARFSLARAASTSDFLVPTQGQEGRHEISLQFLPPSAAQAAAGQPANYLASAAPDADETVPRVEVAISPIDPNPEVTGEPDPDCKDPEAPAPEVVTNPGQPADPGADPGTPGDKVFRGTIVTTWGEASDDNPHPGRVLLKVKTPSSEPISVTDAKGNVFAADFARDAAGNPVRDEDGTYTLVLDPTAVGRGELTFKQEPNGAYTGSTWVYDVTVRPDSKITPETSVSKRAENLTHPNGPTQPGDRIRYTVTASNAAAGSSWNDVVLSDPLPACLQLDERSVRLASPSAPFEGKLEKTAGTPKVGQYSLSAPGADGRRVLEAPAGSVHGAGAATLTFECTVREELDFSDQNAVDLENVASATGTRPDPDHPDDPDAKLPENPDPSDPAAPPGGSAVAPADPSLRMEKAVENVSAPGAEVTRLGDVLRYTVTLENAGAAGSCLMGAVVSDPLPAGMEPVAGTIRLAVDGGEPVAVDDAAYDAASRTIAVTCGDLWGGQKAVLTFDVAVGEAALGADNANIAEGHGKVPSDNPGSRPEAPDPGDPAEPPADEPAVSTPPVAPPAIVGDDPQEGDVAIGKTAENTSRGDGTTHVGDTVRYEITLRNEGAGTSWMDAVIRDDVPEGLEPVGGTIRLTLPDGSEAAVGDEAYDPESRVLAVAVGHLHGGQAAVLRFDALVTEAAVGADIGNVAVGYGTPPSAWDPDAERPEPGAPFDPPGGWDSWEEGRGKVVSDPAYPPGADKLGGVLPGDEGDRRRTTIAHKLAQTGDALAALAGIALAGALAAAALALAARRRRAR
ncbi:hypothetical protein VIN30_08580 [Adlercreutzia sp. R7]|uniref:Gram-positive cocci surface proteins LPxTG domain-containing protein n=1 Tax=Adlercreutzia wanghongyangiae TaxID=3111451 RepID=A0ABU6IJA0_9ACTN|nr:hypothetical protein [Adlercreutzia sp. R7]